MILEVKDVDSGYGAEKILSGITFSVESGDIAGVIGPNGSGKTTLIRTISRALRPSKGAVLLSGQDVQHMKSVFLARNVAVVSQNIEISPMTVEEFVLLGRIPHHASLQFFESRKDFEIAEHSMTLTDTLRFRDKLITRLSGGERQMVFIARALAQEPKLLLLDEPTSHLDITHQVITLDLIKKLNRGIGLTVIMVLHDLNLAGEYCNRLILFSRGRLRTTGTPEDVLQYTIIEEVYKTVVVVAKNPISKKPFVLAVSGETGKKKEDGKNE